MSCKGSSDAKYETINDKVYYSRMRKHYMRSGSVKNLSPTYAKDKDVDRYSSEKKMIQ